ncbi:MAG: VOC family protein [Planctomycetota bacterium]|jgi:catechol 2,3-dioxygenase-like lactoylglutathione lyase family enzyme
MEYRLEHANITVRDMDRALRFLTTAFPDFRVRGTSRDREGDQAVRWIHIGTDTTYVCLNPVTAAEPVSRTYEDPGINHVGFVVDDTEELKVRMEAAGYTTKYAEPHPYRRRLYVADDDGLSWEFVEYFSDDPAERNDYKL